MTRTTASLASVCLVAASCGGGSSGDDAASVDDSAPATDGTVQTTVAPTTAAPTTVAPTTVEPTTAAPTTVAPTTTVDPGPRAAESLAEARGAVVQIVSTGTFADPVAGSQANVPGSGSAFVIDPSGLAVTNNHVVTGAALLEVFVADEATPRNARVVGVSECSDLAVIDIDGADLPYLEWSTEPATAGTEIYALGFPLGDPEYTVLDGIVSKERAEGETSWASVDAVIEHSADTLPGNSGGPVVNTNGKVVAVNYAGNEAGQSFAIGREAAQPVLDILLEGMDHESIGINGEIVYDETLSGVWVSSVESGSTADTAGVRAGDFIIAMEEIGLGVDGTMSDYCDILRSHASTDTMSIEVYRSETDQLLAGQLNGRALEVATSFETQLDDVVADETAVPEYTDYVEVTDESALISVSVPAEWAEIDGRGWESALATGEDEIIGPALTATSDMEGYIDGWETPGVFIGASPLIELSAEEAIDRYDFSESCRFDSRNDYDDGTYTGLYDLYVDCGPADSVFLQVMATPPDQSWVAMVQIVAVTTADLVAADRIFETFVVQPLAG